MIDTVFSEAGFIPAPQDAPLTPQEEEQVQVRLWTMLTKQVHLQTQGDHSSLREEDAAELLHSLMYSLQYQLHRQGKPIRVLLTADLASLLKQAQGALQHELDTAKTLYLIALRSVSAFASCSLMDTLAGIRKFFKLYDVRLHAHAIPASIDYPLCAPVPDSLRGVLYIREYLERLLTENRLVISFTPDRVAALLRRSSPDYQELLVNLYEPVAANVVGLSLLGGGETLLEITAAQAAWIHHHITKLPALNAREKLAAAAVAACRRLSLADIASIAYLSQAAEALYPRIVLSPQGAAGVFSACGASSL